MKASTPALLLSFFLFAATASAAAGRPAVPKVVGMSILEARKAVIAAGWKPRPTFEPTNEDPTDPDTTLESAIYQAGDLYRAGAIEVEACAWMGTVPCSFNYQSGNHCLQLGTDGESDDPVVVAVEERCPETKWLEPPSNLNLETRPYAEAKDVLERIGWRLADGQKEDCSETGVEPCTFRFERGNQCQRVTTGADIFYRRPVTVVLKQEEGCPAAAKN
jgi:hypothetical protein